MAIGSGPKWCYDGRHTVKPLPDNDQRCNYKDVVVIRANQNMQNERVLKIVSEGHWESELEPKLAVNLPNLEDLQIVDVSMGPMELTEQRTPKLSKLFLQTPSQNEDTGFVIELPELRDCSIYYWGPGDYQWVISMLNKATKLERFDSYKLRVSHLGFYSNHLRSIRLHRAELMESLDLWTPNLVDLNIQACCDLECVKFLKDHVLQQDLPSNFVCHEELRVDAMNACLGPEAIEEINSHPRVHEPIDPDDGDDMW
jgi:hypothetical protein